MFLIIELTEKFTLQRQNICKPDFYIPNSVSDLHVLILVMILETCS